MGIRSLWADVVIRSYKEKALGGPSGERNDGGDAAARVLTAAQRRDKMGLSKAREVKGLVVHIMPVRGLLRQKVNPKTSAAIISTWEGVDESRIPCPYALAEYADVDFPSPTAFSHRQARAFARFLAALDSGVTDLYVCCDAGQSRSPAIAAAVLRQLGLDDSRVWDNPLYQPNMLCFCTMLEALGLAAEDAEIDDLIQRSRNAWKKARGGVL